MFDKGRKEALVEILIHDDLYPEPTECFTAELHFMERPNRISFTTVCIMDAYIVLCTFQQSKYFVYESTGHVMLMLNTSRPTASDFEVYVDVIHGIGNASGE